MTLPDGRVITNIPEGTTQEEVMQKLQRNNIKITIDPVSVTPDVTEEVVAETVTPEMAEPPKDESALIKMGDELGRQLGLTARALIKGGADVTSILYNPIAHLTNKIIGTNIAPLGYQAEQASSAMGLPEPQNDTERLVQEIGAGMTAGGTFAGAGKALASSPNAIAQAIGQTLAKDAGSQVLSAGGFYGGSEYGKQQGQDETGQLISGIVGGIAGAGLPALAQRLAPASAPKVAQTAQALTPEQEIIALGKETNIPVMTSDVLPPKTFTGKMAQATGERIPVFGTGNVRANQQTARVDAIKQLAKDYGVSAETKYDDLIASDLIRKRGADLTKYSGFKNEVFSKLDDAGAVPTTNAIAKIDEEIARLDSLGAAVPPQATKLLTDFKSSLQNKNISQVEDVRKLLGDQIAAPELASARTVLDKIPSRVYKELNKDIENFIKANGENRDFVKWKVANKRLSNLANEANNAKLKTALNKGDETPETVNRLLFSQNESDVRRLYRNLTPDGKANARSAVIQKAINDAGGIDAISTNKFLTSINKMQGKTGVLFSGEERKQLDGLVRVLDATRRASDAVVAPPTGVQLTQLAGASALSQMMGNWLAGLAAGGTIGGVARVYESAPMRNFLVKLSATKKNSAAEQQLLKQIYPAAFNAEKNNIGTQP